METNWNELKYMIVNGNSVERQESLIKIKDAVIGSNRQKGDLIACGLVPVLLDICAARDVNTDEKINALIILGSLAKGSVYQIGILVKNYEVISILMKEIAFVNNNKRCIEICLSTMQSIYEQPFAPVDVFFNDGFSLTNFLNLASAQNSLKTQISVTNILVALCQTYDNQIRLLHAGTIHVLARMICLKNEHTQLSALRCLSSMSYTNRSVADNICVTSFQGKSLPDILNALMSRLCTSEIQLTAAKCLTYIYRSGTLLSTDHRIVHKTLPCLARLCSDTFPEEIRVEAADTLAYLIEIDTELQRTAAISNNLIKSLSQFLQYPKISLKQSALRCFASLAANDETIRKRIADESVLMNAILEGLVDTDSQVKLSSVRCLHSLSRSVQQLRTTFQDHAIWKLLINILSSQPSIDLLIAVTSTICNLVLEFSPSKEPVIASGILAKLCSFTEHEEASLRLNGIWALLNMSFHAEQQVKTDIINALGTKRILELLCDSDPTIVMKTLGLLRNLLSKSHHIDLIMTVHSVQILEAVNVVLDSNYSAEIKEQVLCIVGNIAAEAQVGDYIMNDEKLLIRLGEFLFHPDYKLQAGALFTINNLVHRKDLWSEEKYSRLTELNIIKNVYELNRKAIRNKSLCGDYVYRTVKQIVTQCIHFCPEILNSL